METEMVSQWSGIPQGLIDGWRHLSADAIVRDPDYMGYVRSIDRVQLEATFYEMRKTYQQTLGHFQHMLTRRYGIQSAPMFSEILGAWIMNAIDQPNYLEHIIRRHNRIPREIIRESLPMLLEMLSTNPDERNEWQRAVTILTLPMLIA